MVLNSVSARAWIFFSFLFTTGYCWQWARNILLPRARTPFELYRYVCECAWEKTPFLAAVCNAVSRFRGFYCGNLHFYSSHRTQDILKRFNLSIYCWNSTQCEVLVSHLFWKYYIIQMLFLFWWVRCCLDHYKLCINKLLSTVKRSWVCFNLIDIHLKIAYIIFRLIRSRDFYTTHRLLVSKFWNAPMASCWWLMPQQNV